MGIVDSFPTASAVGYVVASLRDPYLHTAAEPQPNSASAAKQAAEKVAKHSHSWLYIDDKCGETSTGKSACATKSRFESTFSASYKAD
jgi:hypothetical protein